MKYDRFEQLPVWKSAAELGDRVLAMCEHAWFRSHAGVRDQLERAAISVSNNIAEGFERGTTAELLTFLYYARGSAGEIRSMLHILGGRANATAPGSSDLKSEISDLKFQISHLKSQISNLKSEISNLIPLAESISRQLHGWAEHLQNSNIPGPRRLNEASRAEYEQQQRAASFLKNIQRKYPLPRNVAP